MLAGAAEIELEASAGRGGGNGVTGAVQGVAARAGEKLLLGDGLRPTFQYNQAFYSCFYHCMTIADISKIIIFERVNLGYILGSRL